MPQIRQLYPDSHRIVNTQITVPSCGFFSLAFINPTDDVRRVSAITHGHCISTETCFILINIINECLRDRGIGKEKWNEEVVCGLEFDSPFDRLSRIDELPEDEISSSGYVVSTLEAVRWRVLT